MPSNRTRDWISGFVLLGVLTGITGSLLVAWQYHIDTDPKIIGFHFLSLNAGYIAAAVSSRWLLRRYPLRSTAIGSCLLGCGALLALSFVPPPWTIGYRIGGLGVLGLSGGGLAASLLYVLEPYFSRAPAAAVNMTGAMFGLGCTLATSIVAATYFVSSPWISRSVLAAIPLVFAVLFWRSRFPAARLPFPNRPEEERSRRALRDLRSIAAVLFSLLLFFQSGNEWVIAGWLPLFLIRRLGANPIWAVLALAIYFFALTAGRVASRRFFPGMSHRTLLLGGTTMAMGGYLLLSLTTSMTLAWLAVLAIGAGFAPIYPLLTETLDDRFSYHPGFYNGIFSVAITGAMSVPWLISYVDSLFGIQYLMLVPALGSVVVLIVTSLIMFEAKLMGGPRKQRENEIGMAAAAGKQ